MSRSAQAGDHVKELEIITENMGARGAYYASPEGGAKRAELTWRRRHDGVRIANHTFTPPEARGKGIAAKLVDALIADARAQGFKIAPTCPYIARLFEKNPDWADLRA